MPAALVALILGVFALESLGAPQGESTESARRLRQVEEKIESNQLPAAESLLAELLRAEPNSPEVLFRLGYVEYRQRKLGSARLHFQTVVRTAAPAYNSRYFLGRIALLENKPKEAVSWLEPVVASGETNYDAASQLAKAYAAAGEPRKAALALKEAIKATPWDSALYYRLGQLYKTSGDLELAREAFATSSRLKAASREDVEVLMLTSDLIFKGKQSEALEQGARILDRPGADPDALVALGVIYGNANLTSQALKAFERAASQDAALFQAQFNYGLALMKLGRAPDAIPFLARAFQLLPQSYEAAMTLGLAEVMSQKYGDALAPLERARKMDPANARLGALLGTAYLRTGAAAKAVPVLRAAAEAKPGDPAARMLLVEALNTSGDHEHALEAALEARKRFPNLPEAQMAAAQQLVIAGNYREARAAFEAVLALSPGQPEAELGLADSLQRAGEHEAALGHYRASGSSMSARLGEARSLAALRRLDEAQALLESAIRENPADITLRVELSRVYTRLGKSDLASEQTRVIEQLRSRPK
jgi:tetratricopeptide (TPR) repeat protein